VSKSFAANVCMKNKPYKAFKLENKASNSLGFGFPHSLALRARSSSVANLK